MFKRSMLCLVMLSSFVYGVVTPHEQEFLHSFFYADVLEEQEQLKSLRSPSHLEEKWVEKEHFSSPGEVETRKLLLFKKALFEPVKVELCFSYLRRHAACSANGTYKTSARRLHRSEYKKIIVTINMLAWSVFQKHNTFMEEHTFRMFDDSVLRILSDSVTSQAFGLEDEIKKSTNIVVCLERIQKAETFLMLMVSFFDIMSEKVSKLLFHAEWFHNRQKNKRLFECNNVGYIHDQRGEEEKEYQKTLGDSTVNTAVQEIRQCIASTESLSNNPFPQIFNYINPKCLGIPLNIANTDTIETLEKLEQIMLSCAG